MSFLLGKELVSNFGLSVTEKCVYISDDDSEREVAFTFPFPIESNTSFQSDFTPFNQYESPSTSLSIIDQDIGFVRYLFEPLLVKEHSFHELVYDLRPLASRTSDIYLAVRQHRFLTFTRFCF